MQQAMIQEIPQRISEGRRFHALGHLDAAADAFQKVLSTNPHDAEALHLLGITTMQQGQLAFSIRCLAQAVQLSPDNALFHQDLGKALMAANDRVNAERYFTNAAQLNAGLYETWFELGNTYLDGGKTGEALEAYYRALELDPFNAQLHYNIGMCLLSASRADEAITHYERAIELDSMFTAAYVNIGVLLHIDKQLDAAERMFRRALEIDQQHNEGKINLAELLIVKENIADAVDILNRLGEELRAQGRLDSAADVYYRLTQLQPQEFEHWFQLGRMLRWQGASDAALSVFEHCLTLMPHNDQLLIELGLLHAARGQQETAELYLSQANEVVPGDVEVVIHLADLYLARGDNDAAYRCLAAAVQTNPDDADLHYRIGIAHYQTGDFDSANADWRHAVSLNPDFAEAHMKLAHDNLMRGRLSQGWRHHVWRFALAGEKVLHPQKPWYEIPRASSLEIGDWRNKHVLVVSENAIEQTLFFTRFLPVLRDFGAILSLVADREYLPLLSPIPGVNVLTRDNIPHHAYDVVVSLGDLPLLLKIDGIDYLPPPLSFSVEPETVAQLRRELQGGNKKPLLGIALQADLVTCFEEPAWQTFAKLLRQHKGEVVIFGLNAEQHRVLQKSVDRNLIDGGRVRGNSEEELLWIAAMDDMIVGDEYYLQLRAACSRKARALVPHPWHWQWLLYSDESPWYPGFRLYRQNALGSWDYALARLARDLA